MSGHRKNRTDQGPLTFWRRQTEQLVRTLKESNRLRPTHILETADRATCQDTQTIRPTEAHSHPGDGRQRDLSGHRNNLTDRGPLTSWRRQTERLVRTLKESDRPWPTHQLETADRATCQDTKRSDQPRPTHSLEMADRGTCQDTETVRPTEAHSHPGDGRQKDWSGHRRKKTDRATGIDTHKLENPGGRPSE